jgi:hypothetical protein
LFGFFPDFGENEKYCNLMGNGSPTRAFGWGFLMARARVAPFCLQTVDGCKQKPLSVYILYTGVAVMFADL